MYRTTLVLPETLKRRVLQESSREKISFSEMVRKALEKYLLSKHHSAQEDSFFSNKILLEDEGPKDVSRFHDRYLSESFLKKNSKKKQK
ncbi:MAG: hypothetical protein HQM15_03100 [Deltaproteobacteria bacterium]|nr:hypothetical protein [Deltaproteobacteria bacterium]